MRDSLCWFCAIPGTSRCCWDRDLTPVPGWTALPSTTDGFDTFQVLECPLFEQEKPRARPHEHPIKLTDDLLRMYDQMGLSLADIVKLTGAAASEVYTRRYKLRKEQKD